MKVSIGNRPKISHFLHYASDSSQMSAGDAILVRRNDGQDHDVSSLKLPAVPLPLSMQGGDQKANTEELMDLWNTSQKEYNSSPTASASCSEETICAPRTEKDNLDVSSLHLAGATKVVYNPDIIIGSPPSSNSSASASSSSCPSSSSLSAARRASPSHDIISLARTDNRLVDVGTFETVSSKEKSSVKSSGRYQLAYTPSPPVPEEDDGTIQVHRSEVSPHIQLNAAQVARQPLSKFVAVPSLSSPCRGADLISIPRSGVSGVSSISSGSGSGSDNGGGSNASLPSRNSFSSDGGDDSVISAHRAVVTPRIVVDTKLLEGVASITDAGLVPARSRSVSGSSSVADDTDETGIHLSRGRVSAHMKVDPSALANTGGLGLGLLSPDRSAADDRILLRRTEECKTIRMTGVATTGSETHIAASSTGGSRVQKKKRWSYTDPSTSGGGPGQDQPSDASPLRLPLSVFARLGMSSSRSSSVDATKPKRRSWTTPGDSSPSVSSACHSTDGDVIMLRRSDVAAADLNLSNIKLPPKSANPR